MLTYQQGLEACRFQYLEMTHYLHVVEASLHNTNLFLAGQRELGDNLTSLIHEHYRPTQGL